jgi:hypothetical protein
MSKIKTITLRVVFLAFQMNSKIAIINDTTRTNATIEKTPPNLDKFKTLVNRSILWLHLARLKSFIHHFLYNSDNSPYAFSCSIAFEIMLVQGDP